MDLLCAALCYVVMCIHDVGNGSGRALLKFEDGSLVSTVYCFAPVDCSFTAPPSGHSSLCSHEGCVRCMCC